MNHPDKKKEPLILDGTKITWHTERVKKWLAGEKIAPITIDMALTRACNFNCVYCYSKLQSNPGKTITREVIYNFLEDAANIGVKAISLVSDGESTLSKVFVDTIVHGAEVGLSMACGTNGFLLDTDVLKKILPHLTYLRINISAGEPERYSEIMGVPRHYFHRVTANIKEMVRLKAKHNYPVTLGMQMVLMPAFKDQILPLARLGKTLGVDYLVIKHTSDDEDGSLGVDYTAYEDLYGILEEAEQISTEQYKVVVKWSKIKSQGQRTYHACYGPPFILQLSGSGLVAPCGMLFGEKYKRYHIGNIVTTRFKEIWQSSRYWDVMNELASSRFDARTMCGCLCLQHKVNEYLDALKKGEIELLPASGAPPIHINFI